MQLVMLSIIKFQKQPQYYSSGNSVLIKCFIEVNSWHLTFSHNQKRNQDTFLFIFPLKLELLPFIHMWVHFYKKESQLLAFCISTCTISFLQIQIFARHLPHYWNKISQFVCLCLLLEIKDRKICEHM